jgi:hypothetical protein
MQDFGKLGRLAHNPAHLRMCLQAHEVLDLSRMPSRPAARDWSQVAGVDVDYQMWRNDDLGDCGIASLLGLQTTWARQSGTPFMASDEDAVDGYRRLGGYVPGDPRTDRGVVMLDVLHKLIGGETLAGERIVAGVSIDPTNEDMMDGAAEFFGGLWMGYGLPKAWQTADVWDGPPNGRLTGDWAPWSWGGHAVAKPGYSPRLGRVITWKRGQPVTPYGDRAYCEEAYGLVSERLWFVLVGDRCPAGIDVQRLMDAFPELKR